MPKIDRNTPLLRVEVRTGNGDVVDDAKVSLRPRQKSKVTELKFDKDTTTYVAKNVPPGPLQIDVKHSRLQAQTREITVGPSGGTELFILGEKGVKTYFREKVRMPVDADPDLFAFRLARNARSDKKIQANLIKQMKLERMEAPPLAEKAGVHLFRGKRSTLEETITRLSENEQIEHAGAVVSMREKGFSFLTGDVVVQFRGPRTEEVRRIAKEHGYTLVRELVYAPTTYVLRWQKPATLAILDSIEKLAARDDVEWAEPSLAITPELDSIIPTDFLWPGLWDRQLVGVQDAWQSLQDAGLDTFGDPDILLAVWDSGVQSAAGVPTNADFNGTVSSGDPKVFAVFDFWNMLPHNDSPWDPHGSGVAGVSAALANNPAPVPGPAFGVVGAAPNVRIMTVAGDASIDIEVADQYIWMAGFDPQSPTPGFPAQLSRGADVITCSLTPGAGAVLSGTARAVLDFVTTFGRGGKGTMCFFSTGNNNQNNVTARPYGAYEKCFGIAATSFADDGVTEVRGPYSGWGQIALCSPSHDVYVANHTFHNPPTNFAPWGGHHQGAGNVISFAQTQTTLTAATAVGATVLSVVSVVGFAVNSVIHLGAIGALGSEPARVTAVNAAMNQLTVQGHDGGSFTGALLHAHAAADAVVTGPANHRNNFGGTSSATPLCAGAAALVLSANPALTYIEARQILRDTALKFDLANTNPAGQWLDANGNPSVTSGNPPVRSGWYGYGRVNAAAAVASAVTFGLTRDLVIRDNLADTGAVATPGAFWNSPDIWCRRNAPGGDPGAIPANYGTAGPHEDPMRGQSNWIYARIRNNGTTASLDAWVRLSITHWPGLEFTYPASFQPLTGPGDPLPVPMTHGTYFIGEVKVTGLAPGADQIVNVEWPSALIPPVSVGGANWHPCLLAEITPHDGPSPTGNHVWDDNNLAQKNISIVGTDAGTDFAFATVIGHQDNLADYLWLEINRGRLPADVRLYVDLKDPLLRRRLRQFDEEWGGGPPTPHRGRCCCECCRDEGDVAVATQVTSSVNRHGWTIGWHEGREVVFLKAQPRVRVPVVGGAGRISPLVVGGVVSGKAKAGSYEIVVIQRQPDGELSGSATAMLKVGK